MKSLMKQLVMGMVLVSGLSPVITQPIQVDAQRTTIPVACALLVDGQEIDTETSMYPTVSYDIVEANRPSDRIVIDEATLYSNELLLVEDITETEVYTHNYTSPQTYRDYSFWPMYYLTYDNGDMEILAPINMTEEMSQYYTVIDFLSAQSEDLSHKLFSDFVHALSDDPVEIYHLTKGYAPSIMADAKGNLLRSEEYVASLEADDPDYDQAIGMLEEIQYKYHLLEGRYNNACGEKIEYDFIIDDEVTDVTRSEELVTLIEETLATLPTDLQGRLFEISIVPQSKINTVMERDDIKEYAKPERQLYFSEEMFDDPALIYHEVAHVLDFSVHMPTSMDYEEFTRFSTSDEWLAIHEAEWFNSEDEKFYYNEPIESFAQAFAGIMMERVHGIQLSEENYVNTDIADRPMSKEYFEQLFKSLGFDK